MKKISNGEYYSFFCQWRSSGISKSLFASKEGISPPLGGKWHNHRTEFVIHSFRRYLKFALVLLLIKLQRIKRCHCFRPQFGIHPFPPSKAMLHLWRSSPHRTIEIRFKQLSFGIQRIRARKRIYIFIIFKAIMDTPPELS